MAKLVTINSVTSGTSPYDVWVCDTCFGTCQYIDTTSTIPFTFTLPEIFETYITFTIKVIDANDCVTCYEYTEYKQYEDEIFFEFMDDIPFEFQ